MAYSAVRALSYVLLSLLIFLFTGLYYEWHQHRADGVVDNSKRNSNDDHLSTTFTHSIRSSPRLQSSTPPIIVNVAIPPSQASFLSTTTKRRDAPAATYSMTSDERRFGHNKSIILEISNAIERSRPKDRFKQIRHNTNESSEPAAVKVINPHPFKYILDNPNICRDRDIYLLAFVLTAPHNFKQRDFIRRTWGSATNYDAEVQVIFILGRVADSLAGQAVQRAVLREFNQYGDIVQKDFIDTYQNLTHKSISALRWTDERCSHAHWILKIDDDVFLNGFNLLRYLHSLDSVEMEEKVTAAASRHVPVDLQRLTRGQLICFRWIGERAHREGKWKVDKSMWPHDFYPNFCSGIAYVMSSDVAVALHRASYTVPFLWLEDVFLTGIVADKLGTSVVRTTDLKSAYNMWQNEFAAKFTGPERFQYIFSHGPRNLKILEAVWEKIEKTERDIKPAMISTAAAAKLHKLAIN